MRAYVIGAFVLTASWAAACGSDDDGDGAADPTDAGGSGGTAGSSTGGVGDGGTGGRGSGGTPSGGTGNTGGTLPEGSVGGSGGASTDGGAPDGSVGDASVGADGAASDGAAIVDAGPCAVLEACCDTVQQVFEASCRQAVSTSTAQECTALQGFFCGAGVPEGGGPPQADAASCTALQACCDQLTGVQQTQCNTVVGIGIAFVCDAQMGTYCP